MYRIAAFAAGAFALVAACTINVEGAACASDDNCPTGQTCVTGKCRLFTGSAGGSAAGGAAGGANGGGAPAGGASGGGDAGGNSNGGGLGGGDGGGAAGGGGATTGGGSAAGGMPGGCDAGTLDDVLNCGTCGRVCPTPLNAQPLCRNATCGRSACSTGFFDVDGVVTFGCESTCTGRMCALPDGGSLSLSQEALPERAVFRAGFPVSAAGQSSSTQHVNVGVVFTLPEPVDGGAELAGGSWRHRGGLLGGPR